MIVNLFNYSATLTNLNEKVTGCNEQWVLNSQNCTSIKTGYQCQSVSTTENFGKDRSCVTDKEASQESFDILKNYLQGQSIMMEKMILELRGAAETTPKSTYTSMRSKFDKIKTSFDTIVAALFKTFLGMSNYKKGFNDITNCRILNREMKLFSAGICFKFRPYANTFFLYLALSNLLIKLGTLFLLVVNWLLCMLEREVSGEIKIAKEEIYSKGVGGDEEDGNEKAIDEESEESEVDDEEIFKKKPKG